MEGNGLHPLFMSQVFGMLAPSEATGLTGHSNKAASDARVSTRQQGLLSYPG